MPKIGDYVSPTELPCERCNSKRKVSKTWIEKLENPNGFMTLYHSQIICTNKQCQADFEKIIAQDEAKRLKIKEAKSRNTTTA